MPIYEYKCRDCGLKFEELVYTDSAEVRCRNCGSEKAERLLSGFATSGSGSGSSGSCSGSGRFV